MTELVKFVLGTDIISMCKVLDEKFPKFTDETDIIQKGVSALLLRFTLGGFVIGVTLTVLCILVWISITA